MIRSVRRKLNTINNVLVDFCPMWKNERRSGIVLFIVFIGEVGRGGEIKQRPELHRFQNIAIVCGAHNEGVSQLFIYLLV